MWDGDELTKAFMQTAHRFGKLRHSFSFSQVSSSEFMMLEKIGKSMDQDRDSGIYVSELAKHLRVSSPAVSRMLRSLEQKNLIMREVDRDDRRNTYVYLTEQGCKIRNKTKAEVKDFTGRVFKRMGEEDIKVLLTLWGRLADIMEEELGPDKGDRHV